ncbi:MAG: discoidin domain-containing protein [Clostridia bacterium]|nr:discoidin domain-containing protein [Clostridia bacterium]
MKKIFLRRILPVALCLLMVVPMALSAFAVNLSLTGKPGDTSIIGTERQNWAPNGSGYHTSVWNNDRHSKYLNNETYDHSYQYWQPSDPARPNGAGVDATKQHVGFSFDDGYYVFDEVVIYANSYPKGQNNIKYRVEALILGEWVEVGVGYQDDGVKSDKGGDVTKLSIKLTHPDGEYINTNNVRIWCSEYGSYAKRYGDYADKPATWHDWWLTPCMQEVELIGYTGYRPEFDVPMNAYLVTNAALSGMVGADTSMDMRYPGLAADNDSTTNWKAMKRGAQNIWAEFDKAYKLDNVGINVGGCDTADQNLELTYNIKILTAGTITDGTWEYVVKDQKATTVKDNVDPIVHKLDEPKEALAMMVEITAVSNNGRAVMTELVAEIADGGKCIFLADYITNAKKVSTATGNLACYGAAYASSNFAYAGVSKIPSIIDGNISYDDDAWIALDYILGTYAGVTLREAHDVTKVVLYFGDALGGTNGEHVFKFDLQAKIDGEFKTVVADATSYDAARKSYTISLVLDQPVHTDDVRIVFKSDAHTFPYLKEIEVFEGDFVYSSYHGYALDTSRTQGGPAATTEFGSRTVSVRGKYFSKQSPLSYFNIALEHDVEIDWLG